MDCKNYKIEFKVNYGDCIYIDITVNLKEYLEDMED